jgi:hypothetical protein
MRLVVVAVADAVAVEDLVTVHEVADKDVETVEVLSAVQAVEMLQHATTHLKSGVL